MPKLNPINAQTRKQSVRPAVCDSLPAEAPYYEELQVSGDMSFFSGVEFCNEGFSEPGEVPVNGGHMNINGITLGGAIYHLYLNYKFGVDFRLIDIQLTVTGWSCRDIDESWLWDIWASQERFTFTALLMDALGELFFTVEVGPRP